MHPWASRSSWYHARPAEDPVAGDPPGPRPRTGQARIDTMTVERCAECGFDGDEWTDSAALEAITELPSRWSSAVRDLTFREATRRPYPRMWSIAEYADHVRKVLSGMHFLLDTAVRSPETNLGPSSEPRFDPQPQAIEIADALAGIAQQATGLARSFAALRTDAWAFTVTLDGSEIDPHWIARHAVHDATHHLLDVRRLRDAL